MTKKLKRVRVIKKNDLKVIGKVVKDETKAKQEAAREMVSNVSTWVNDFQKRKRHETKQAIEQLFPTPAQTDGA